MSKPDINTYGGRLFSVGYVGQVATEEPSDIDSFVNTSATAVDFGRMVVRDTNDRSCKVMAADADLQLGFSARHPESPASTDGVNTVNYIQYKSVPVMRFGVMFVLAAEDVRRGDQVLAITAGGGTVGGSKGGVAGSGRIDVPGAVWEDTTSATTIGRIRVFGSGTRRVTT